MIEMKLQRVKAFGCLAVVRLGWGLNPRVSLSEPMVSGFLILLLTQHVVKDDSWVPTSGSPPCWWWGYQTLMTGSKWAAIIPVA